MRTSWSTFLPSSTPAQPIRRTPTWPGQRDSTRREALIKSGFLSLGRTWVALSRRRRKIPAFPECTYPSNKIGIGGFSRGTPRERRRRARALEYTLDLLLPGERKSMQPTAARVRSARYEAMQDFITDSPWDWRETRARLLEKMADGFAGADGQIVIDDVPLVKPATESPGVGRQYCGVTGDVRNCQVLVDAVHVRPRDGTNRGAAGFCFALGLYLPKAWAESPGRCREAGIPWPVIFRPKWRIGWEPLDRLRELAVPHRAVVADCGYGDGREFRAELRARREAYVMEVTASEARVVPASTPVLPPGERAPGARMGRRTTKAHIVPGTTTTTPQAMAAVADDWTTVRWSKGTPGILEGPFLHRKVRACGGSLPTDEVGWLLLEDRADGLRAWICWGLNEARLENLAAIAHRRWGIEQFHEDAKRELGLDHLEARRWRGLNHHLTWVLIAHTFRVREQARVVAMDSENAK